jgi:5,10-methylenetetrahydrofolate reductase
MKKILEISTPLAADLDELIASIQKRDDFDAILVGECGGISALLAAEKIGKDCGKDIILKIECRDRNRIALHSELLTAGAMGLFDVVIADGAHPANTQFPDAKPVYDLDALGLLRLIKLKESALGSMPWRVSVVVGASSNVDMKRVEKFLEAGADMFFASSPECAASIIKMTDKPVILSINGSADADPGDIAKKAEAAGTAGICFPLAARDGVPDASLA